MKFLAHRAEHHPKYYHASSSIHGTCRVKEVKEEGEVCCGPKCNTCEAGIKSNLKTSDWYKFTDEATRSEDLMDEWREVEEWETREFAEHGDEYEREWKSMIEKEDREDHHPRIRRKRGWNKLQKSFTCYKIVLEGWKNENDAEGEWDYLFGASSGMDSSSEEDYREHHRGGHHGREHHGKHHSGERFGDRDEHRERKEKRQVAAEPEPGMRRDMRESRKRPGEWDHDDEDRKDRMEESDMDEWKEEMEGERREKLENAEFTPEAGIVVLADHEPVDGVYTSMFYDGVHTMERYSQCSYSACGGGRCRTTVDIEEKIKKWRARLESKEEFDCSVQEDKAYAYHEDHGKWRCSRYVRLIGLPFGGIMMTLLIIFIVRRVRACKLRREQCRLAAAAATSTPAEYAYPEKQKPATLSKEEEANMPPSAPPMVWTTTLPDYEKGSEEPPAYKSTADLQVAWAEKEGQEEKKDPDCVA